MAAVHQKGAGVPVTRATAIPMTGATMVGAGSGAGALMSTTLGPQQRPALHMNAIPAAPGAAVVTLVPTVGSNVVSTSAGHTRTIKAFPGGAGGGFGPGGRAIPPGANFRGAQGKKKFFFNRPKFQILILKFFEIFIFIFLKFLFLIFFQIFFIFRSKRPNLSRGASGSIGAAARGP